MSVSKAKLDHGSIFGDLLGAVKTLSGEAEQRALPLASIVTNPMQPRRYSDEPALAALAASIQANGVLEPILVRPSGEGFEVVAGERRTRAARLAGLESIPAIIRQLDEHQALEIAIIENLQRQDLSPVEETDAILRLIAMRLQRTQEEVIEGIRALYDRARGRDGNTGISNAELVEIQALFEALGRFTPSSFYTNRIPLLYLPADILSALREGKLDYSKARMIARVTDDRRRRLLLQKVIAEGLSREAVRRLLLVERGTPPPSFIDTQRLLRRVKRSLTTIKISELESKQRAKVERLLSELEEALGIRS
jgi:ParB family chromosome partitioning protein